MHNMDIITDVNRRHEFYLLFDVTDGNPNGDPDAANLPRLDPETMQGITTDVMLKRKIRDYVNTIFKMPIFIQSENALNTLIRQAFLDVGYEPVSVELQDDEVSDSELLGWIESKESLGYSIEENRLYYSGDSIKRQDILRELSGGLEEDKQEMAKKIDSLARRLADAQKGKDKKSINEEMRDEARKKLCEKYYDIRMFGAVLSTGLNAGQVRGPVQLTFSRSFDPIYPLDVAITRKARTTLSRRAREGETEMGRKPTVPYGLYRAFGFYNPFLAEITGVTQNDLTYLYEALQNIFELDRSATRGSMAVRGLAVFTHENKKGNAPAERLFGLIKVLKKDGVHAPRSFEDYRIIAPSEGSLETFSFRGVTLTWLVEPLNMEVLDRN